MVPRFDLQQAEESEVGNNSPLVSSTFGNAMTTSTPTQFLPESIPLETPFMSADSFESAMTVPSGHWSKGSYPWKYSNTQWPPMETFSTSTYSNSQPSALAEHAPSLIMSSQVSSNPLSSDTATGFVDYGDGNPAWANKQSANHAPMYAAAAIVPVVTLAIVGALVFPCMRKRRRQRQIVAAQPQVQEMASRDKPTVSAYIAAPIPTPRQPRYTAPPFHEPPRSLSTPPPVILGPISGSSNGNYMTGIDTSDMMSMRNEHIGSDPFANGNGDLDEPPPPYRPRSIAPPSRHTSRRSHQPPPFETSRTNLMSNRAQPIRSPFDDPQDDDTVSELSSVRSARRNPDSISIVSDLSYQQDPTVGSPAV